MKYLPPYLLSYQRWIRYPHMPSDLMQELLDMESDSSQIQDAFYRDLSFGTGGLRGLMGAGTNRMNRYTVGRATQGLANHLLAHNSRPTAVIGYDSRLKSDVFAKHAASVLAANGICVFFWSRLLPVPLVSFAIRYLQADAGIMITASHNPATYNGYKVYGRDGCQITKEEADAILREINGLDLFHHVSCLPFQDGIRNGMISYIHNSCYLAYLKQIKATSLFPDNHAAKDFTIVYSPLHGTGLEPVVDILRESGFTGLRLVTGQTSPDGHFPTCPTPNPEIPQALSLAIATAKECRGDLVLATDPDCDRVGVALRKADGGYTLLTGNETGLLLLDYICTRRIALGSMPPHPLLIKTIVTTVLAEKLAAHYGVDTCNVLTGFKYIGEQIGALESQGALDRFLFAFEESYGYLSGTYVRDKDGVGGVFLICEMFAYYASMGISLLDRLSQIYATFGFAKNSLYCFPFEGSKGFENMERILNAFRNDIHLLGGYQILWKEDYSNGIKGLPASNVIQLHLANQCDLIIRPSGTEPKLKIYLSLCASTEADACIIEEKIINEIEQMLENGSF